MRLAITCTPLQYILVTNAHLGVESQGSPMRIKNTGDSPVDLFRPELTGGYGNIQVRFDMNERVTLQVGEGLDLKTFVTPLSADSLYGQVVMKTTSVEMPTIEIEINGTMAPPATKPDPSN